LTCPKCSSENVIFSPVEFKDELCLVEWLCCDCDHVWRSVSEIQKCPRCDGSLYLLDEGVKIG
jgi:hypothetical protein